MWRSRSCRSRMSVLRCGQTGSTNQGVRPSRLCGVKPLHPPQRACGSYNFAKSIRDATSSEISLFSSTKRGSRGRGARPQTSATST